MAISQQQRTDLLTLLVGMFDAAPGSDILDELANGIDNGNTIEQYAANLINSDEFTGIYSRALTAEEFATSFVANLIGDAVDAATTAEAEAYVAGRLNAGASRDVVIIEALAALSAVSEDDAVWGAAAAQLNNKVEVAEYFATQSSFTGLSLAQMQAALNGVTSDDATVTAKKEAIDAGDLEGVGSTGQTFTLTQGLDTFTGTSGNDTFNAYAFNSVTGADTTTLQSVDTINGGEGTDTLNIEVKAANNATVQGNISNIEIVNINNEQATAAAAVDASDFGAELEQVWQIGAAAAVTELASTTTAGFRDTAQAAALSVTGATSATSVSVALDDVADADLTNGNTVTLNVAGSAVATANVSGTIAAGTNTPATQTLTVNVDAGKDLASFAFNSATDATLTLAEDAATATDQTLTALDASGSTGDITFGGQAAQASDDTAYNLRTITTGSGDDTVDVATVTAVDNTATAADETVTSTVTTGEGDDTVNVATSGAGITTISTGAGDDTVSVTARSTTLNVDMGAGNDSFTSTVAITSKDTIDAGEGVDTLRLSLVGAANVDAFKNFDIYDVVTMNANLDLDLLSGDNAVTELVGSGALGGNVTLENVTTDFRATGNMGTTNALTLTQKTAGALTVTSDADETGTADDGAELNSTKVIASNATSVNVEFDTSYLADTTVEKGLAVNADNYTTVDLGTVAATAVTVTSGGENATNNLVLTDDNGAATVGALTSLTLDGAQDITVTYTADATGSSLATVDASALTGDLTMSLAGLKDGAVVTLGSGQDTITVTNESTVGGVESIVGFEKTDAVSVSTEAADAVAKNAAIADADVLVLGGASVATATSGTAATVTNATVEDGVLSWVGAGPATLAQAETFASEVANDAGEAVVFEYVGNTYAFVNGATNTLVQLTGVTGVDNFVETGTDQFFIV